MAHCCYLTCRMPWRRNASVHQISHAKLPPVPLDTPIHWFFGCAVGCKGLQARFRCLVFQKKSRVMYDPVSNQVTEGGGPLDSMLLAAATLRPKSP